MAFAGTVIGALRRFLPDFLRVHPVEDRARRRAVWALTHCRTATMGGHVHACEKCGTTHFAFHSCNHRSCPQCGAQDTAEWVERELDKRIGAPYFMVTFTLPQELRDLFFGKQAKEVYQLFFAAASSSLAASSCVQVHINAVYLEGFYEHAQFVGRLFSYFVDPLRDLLLILQRHQLGVHLQPMRVMPVLVLATLTTNHCKIQIRITHLVLHWIHGL
jgi:hypothetical protein